jgi:hypothetical protein
MRRHRRYSQFANGEYAPQMDALKPQDLLVLLKVAAHPPQRWTYAALGEALAISASEAHASVKRAVAAGLAVAPARGEWAPVRPNLLEFIVHGVRYIWPASLGAVKRGVPTAFGAEPLASQLTVAPGEAPVWAHPTGSAKGPAISPLYRTVPQAALADPALHRLLALLDALRTGRARERSLAAKLMEAELMQFDVGDAGAGDARR